MWVLIFILVILAIFYNILVAFIEAINRRDWGFLLMWAASSYILYLIFTNI
jgi:hypothetical protein